MLVEKLDVNALLPMLCRLHFSKSFQSGNNVYCDLNNSTLDLLSLTLFRVLNPQRFLSITLRAFEIIL